MVGRSGGSVALLLATAALCWGHASAQCANNVVTSPFSSPFLATALVELTFPTAASQECAGVAYSSFTVLVPMSCVACVGPNDEQATTARVSFASTFVESWSPASDFYPFSYFESTDITLNVQFPTCPVVNTANDFAIITMPFQLGARTGTYRTNQLVVSAGAGLSATWAHKENALQKSLGFSTVAVDVSNVVTGLSGGGAGAPLFSGLADVCPTSGVGAVDAAAAQLSGLAVSATAGWLFQTTANFPNNILSFMLPNSPADPQDPLVVVDLFNKADGTTRVAVCGVTNDQLGSAAAQDVGNCNSRIEFYNVGMGSSGLMRLQVFLVDATTTVPSQSAVLTASGTSFLVFDQADFFSAAAGATSGELTVSFPRGGAAVGKEYWVIAQWTYPTSVTPINTNIINQRIGSMTWIASNDWKVQTTYHTGDPHFTTLRGNRLDVYAPGEHVFCSRKDDSIQIHPYHNYDTRWTGHATIGKLAVKFGSKVIVMGRNHVNDGGMTFYVDNEAIENTQGKADIFDFKKFPITVTDAQSGYVVTVAYARSGANGVLTLTFNTREVLTWTLITGTHPRMDLHVQLPKHRWFGNSKGLCGGTQRGAVNDPEHMHPDGRNLGGAKSAFLAAWAVSAGAAPSIYPPLSVAKLDGWYYTTNGQTAAPVGLLAAASEDADSCGGNATFNAGVAECDAAAGGGATPDPDLAALCLAEYCKQVRATASVADLLAHGNQTCINAGGDHGDANLEFSCAFDFALELNQTGDATADIVHEYVKHKCPNGCSGQGSCIPEPSVNGSFVCDCGYPFIGEDCSERDICAIIENFGASLGIKAGIVVDRFSSGLDSSGNFVIEVHVPKDHDITLLSLHASPADRAESGEFFNNSVSTGLGGFQRVADRHEGFSLAASCFHSYKVTNTWASIVEEVRAGKGGLLEAGAKARLLSPVSGTYEVSLIVKGTSPEGPIDEVVDVDGHIRQLMLISRREAPTDFVASGARVKTDILLLSHVEVSPLDLSTRATFRLETRSDSDTELTAPTFSVPATFGAGTPSINLLSSSQDGAELVQVWNVSYTFIAHKSVCEIDGLYTFAATLQCTASQTSCPLAGTASYSAVLNADSKDFCPHIVERERLDVTLGLFEDVEFKNPTTVSQLKFNQTAHLLFNVSSSEPEATRAKLGIVNLEHLFATVDGVATSSIGFHRGHRHLPVPAEFRIQPGEGFVGVSVPLHANMLPLLRDHPNAEVTIWSVLSVELLYGSKARVHTTVHVARQLVIDLADRKATAPPTGQPTLEASASRLGSVLATGIVATMLSLSVYHW